MSSGTSERSRLIENLRDKQLRDFLVESSIREDLAFQIRAMRDMRGWTQAELGERAGGIKQETISQLEDPNYGRYTLRTLRRLASAFDVALSVRFELFSRLVDHLTALSPEDLEVPSFDRDEGLADRLPEDVITNASANTVLLGEGNTEVEPQVFEDNISDFCVYQQRRQATLGWRYEPELSTERLSAEG